MLRLRVSGMRTAFILGSLAKSLEHPMPMFRVGDRVCLNRTASLDFPEIGTVVKVIPSDSDLSDFALYDVDFGSGVQPFHGFELRRVPRTVSFCTEKYDLL